jgi:hypothetical protein
MSQAILIVRSIGASHEAQAYIPAAVEMTWPAVGMTKVAEVGLLPTAVEGGAHLAEAATGKPESKVVFAILAIGREMKIGWTLISIIPRIEFRSGAVPCTNVGKRVCK